MKKWSRIVMLALAALAIVAMLPMRNAQALKKKPVMRMELETEQGSSEPAEEEPEAIEPEPEMPKVEAAVEEKTLEENTLEKMAEAMPGIEKLSEPTESSEAADDSPGKQIAVEIQDDAEKELVYENERYVKKITHIITLIDNDSDLPYQEALGTDSDIYESISYRIYQKTNQGEICLQEGFLQIPSKAEKKSVNTIESTYTQTGDYRIRVQAKLKEDAIEELACHDFSVTKDAQEIMLKENMRSLNYGDILYIDNLIDESGLSAYQKEYEIREENPEQKKILEIGKEGERTYIKAVALNNAYRGTTTVKIRLKETEFLEASNEETLTLHVEPMVLNMEVQADASSVYLYDTLTVKVMLQKDGMDVTEELFETDQNLRVGFTITSGENTCVINSKNTVSQIPIKKEYFKEFYKGAKYDISIKLEYEEEKGYFPYIVNTVVKKVELLGRRAVIKLYAEYDGIYDYRTFYQGTMPVLHVELEDVTAAPDHGQDASSQSEGERQKVPPAEEKQIIYHVASTNENVASAGNLGQHVAKDCSIPISINGVGTATLAVTADASDVYTVEGSKIHIIVKDSPLYDEDFEISVLDANGENEQTFCSSEGRTGFEKWQEYLKEHNGWVNGSVKLCLTECGLKYYENLNLIKDEYFTSSADQFYMNTNQQMSEYTFAACNRSTRANTKNCEDAKNGTRSFCMGIDTVPPVMKRFSASTDYYEPTCTEEQQYFSQNFILTGTFADATSGIAAMEYTTDITAENGAKWTLLENSGNAKNEKNFKLALGDGIYNAIAVRAIDAAGNSSEPVCLKNEKGAFIKIIVDSTAPEISVSEESKGKDNTWHEYNAENENWTNHEIRFQASEKEKGKTDAKIYAVEYAYQSIAAACLGKPIEENKWQKLVADERGMAELSIGGDPKNPTNKNGVYYFRGVSMSGVKSASNTEKRVLLWQKMADKKPVVETGADLAKRYNEWYNKESGTPIIDFAYPDYDTGVISGEYAAPITVHYNLDVKDEKDVVTSLAVNQTATIYADFSQNSSPTGFPIIYDDISQLQAKLSDDGIYTLAYWITDAAGNQSETEINTYQVDCHEPAGLKVILDGKQQAVGKERTLVYEGFYQNSVLGEASAEYGISKKGSITLLKAKKVDEWKGKLPTEDAEQFQIDPNMRCLLYIRAVDGAGNMTEGWTRGIVVDNEAPSGEGKSQLIVEPDGANKHGFFNKNVKVKISIQDAPSDGNSAGIKLVTCSGGTDGANAAFEKELFSSTENAVSEGLLDESQRFHIVETIDAKANEGNHAYMTVNATDRSGNVRVDTRELKIDVTKPEITITFDNENAVNGSYYNADRRAKITIKELNFDASLVKIKATKNGADYTPMISGWKDDKEEHYAYVDFSKDGDYTLTAECKDLADNKADRKSVEPFTIDKTKPKVEIALESGIMHKGYFNDRQTAVITVTEHNFKADDFQIKGQPGGSIGSWTHKNDTHVIKVEFLSEGEYAVFCDYTDLAGNEISDEDKAKMPMEFVIDTTKPAIEITGVADNSANAGTVIPNIGVRDMNFNPETVTITLTTGKGIALDISSDITAAHTDGGFLYVLNGLDAKPDDIYYLTVNAVDLAGNASELEYRFSLNRRGSSYDLSDLAKFKDCYYNSYRNLEDIKIVEMNVDKVEEFTLFLSHNADIIYGKSGSRPLAWGENEPQEAVLYGVDVSGSEDTGYVYTYTVYRENFAREGTYRMGIYSKDRAGNEVNNLLKQNGEEIQFAVDNTIPRVVIDGVENNEVYDVSSQEVRVAADDNFKLAKLELELVNKDGEILERWNYFDLVEKEGETARLTIKERNEEVSLLYSAADAAGNEVRTLQGEREAKADFLVTTDKLVQLVYKPVQTSGVRGIVAVLIVLIVLIVFLVSIGMFFVLLKKALLKKRK